CTFITFAALFTNSLLETRSNSPRFYYALYASACINVVLIVLTPVLPYKFAIALASLLATASSLTAIAASLYLLTKGIRTARYYFLAYSFLVFGGILLAA